MVLTYTWSSHQHYALQRPIISIKHGGRRTFEVGDIDGSFYPFYLRKTPKNASARIFGENIN
jgi:hypothetical protein